MERTVPYVDIAGSGVPLHDELKGAFARVLHRGQFVLGAEVDEFEARFAELCGTKFAVGVNSGTDAMILALRALDIGSGDEVITAPNSFFATAAAIVHVGARPVFVDVGANLNIDPNLIEAAVTPATKAILPVHLTGRPADMDAVLEMAERCGLSVIEDAAQAVLARHRGRPVGGLGTLGAFSLHPLKTLGACGDGGVVTTNDEGSAQRLQRLRNHGLANRDECLEWGYNSRLDTIQEALLLEKLNHVEDWTTQRRRNAESYQLALADLQGIRLPADGEDEFAVYHTFVILADHKAELREHLADRGVGSAIHYPVPIHLQAAASKLGHKRGDFPVAESQADQMLSLPVHHGLREEDIRYVADVIRGFYSV